MVETLAKVVPSFATVIWWMAEFKRCRKIYERNPYPRRPFTRQLQFRVYDKTMYLLLQLFSPTKHCDE
jgi:hypothetical protein